MSIRFLFPVLLLLFGFNLYVPGQQPVQFARKAAWQTHVYRISADTAEKYLRRYETFPQTFLSQAPYAVVASDSLDPETLPAGNYLFITAVGNELVTNYYCRSNLRVFALNNQHRVQAEVRNREGQLLNDANVWINGKPAKKAPGVPAFELPGKKVDEAVIKIAIPGDTLFMELWANEDEERSAWQQWWRNFSYTKTGRVITWPVRSVKRMITRPPREWFRKRRKQTRFTNGYMIFNKPKYQPGDTVKFKAYVLNKKYKQVKYNLDAYLDYYSFGKSHHKKLKSLSPLTPGSFIYEFVLGDSLESDRTYTVNLLDKKNRNLMRGNFKLEDYLLDEVTNYNLRAEKESYYPGDTMRFYVNAKDANGLPLMDGRVNLYVIPVTISGFYKDREFITDTLHSAITPLQVHGETKLEVPTQSFPNADMGLKILAEFRNSNNEIQEEEMTIQFTAKSKILKVTQEGGFINADIIENGKPIQAKGLLKEGDEKEAEISFPFRRVINGYAEKYVFRQKNDAGKTILFHEEDIDDYRVLINRVQQQDTTGFSLYNPFRIPVHYTVFYGNKIIDRGGDSTERVTWKKIIPRNTAYTVQWNYVWAGREEKKSETIGRLDKVLQTTIQGAATIYPGQTDTVTATIKDYKGRPAENVNLTAVSYNNQFGKDIRVAEPPYLQRFKGRRRILFDNYEMEEATVQKKFLLGKNMDWRVKLSLDSMLYYKLLFPKDSMAKALQPVKEFAPQAAIHVVKQGVPQEIYMLYLNREFAYYNGVTDRSAYAFPVWPGYTQVGIRLKDQFVEIDSIYLQPFYKYDIVFDLDKLPAKAKVKAMPDYYTYEERMQIEQQIWQLADDYRTEYGYVWQVNKLVYLNSHDRHLAGPFRRSDSLQYFKPGDFDFKFPFENSYEYRITPRMVRLEAKSVLPGAYTTNVKLPPVNNVKWILGDTLPSPPDIVYNAPEARPYFIVNDFTNSRIVSKQYGSLKAAGPKDSVFSYGILYRQDNDTLYKIKRYDPVNFYKIDTGIYNLVLVTPYFSYIEEKNIEIKGGGITCINLSANKFEKHNLFAEHLASLENEMIAKRLDEKKEENKAAYSYEPQLPVPLGRGAISGKVTDEKGGEPIVGAVIRLKGFTTGTVADANGAFELRNLKPGNYVLVVSAVGYETKEVSGVYVNETEGYSVNLKMKASERHLSEVVVVGYGAERTRRAMGFSMASVSANDITSELQGRVSGMKIGDDNVMGDFNSDSVRIRGIATTSKKNPLYVVDGVTMEELPEGFDMQNAQVNVLKGDIATGIYGERAANGVIVITTAGFLPKTLRDQFRDYAFWKPNLFTDEDGRVRFTVTYPDNITGWQTYVVGMDKRRRFTKAGFFTKSFKPLLAQLAAPQFLIEGDSALLIGKSVNYTSGKFSLQTQFSVNDEVIYSGSKELNPNGAAAEELGVVPSSPDTMKVQYTVSASGGFSDGELRKIPVFRKGTEEAKGNFRILEKDTSFTFTPYADAGEVRLYAQNNTLDVLLDEIKHLKEYPYYCMEQTASKLTGLLMEKEIQAALKQKFTGEKELQKLLKKLQESQLFDGGWSWWGGGNTNLSITNYVTQALLPLRKDAVVESNIRNALLFLQNKLPVMKRDALLSSLFTLSEAGHYMDYINYIRKIPFDSLSIHQQWQVVKIKQQQKLDYENELNVVMKKKTETMFGGLHWGSDSYYWESNEMATTALAFKVLEKEERYKPMLKNIIQFFLERRKEGRWRNTVESAKTLETILPTILQQQDDFTKNAILRINNNDPVTQFPFTYTTAQAGVPVTVSKSGGGLVYFTAWQKIFNPAPQPVNDKFVIETWFERSGNNIASLKAGEKAILKVSVKALKDAEFVQIEIPIPAGCTYAEKKQEGWNMHREFLKDKVVLFAEQLNAGEFVFEIELEPRYAGSYHLNPAKAELMYFPTFYGRNEMKRAEISK